MIKSIKIKNFQSHKNTKLDFDPGVNIIIGESSKGKSSIIRALNWVISNKPTGDRFRSHWGGDTSVSVDIDNQKTIIREKGKKNIYCVDNKESKQTDVFEGFGTKVPEEISNLLNIPETNIQKQFDTPFLLKLTPGEVGKQINKAVKLDIIDVTQTNITKVLKQKNRDLLIQQGIKLNKQEKLKEYSWLTEAGIKIKEIESIEFDISNLTMLFDNLNKNIYQFHINDANLNKINLILKYEDDIKKLIIFKKSIGSQNQSFTNLNKLVNDLNKNQDKLNKNNLICIHNEKIQDLINLDKTIDIKNGYWNILNETVFNLNENNEQRVLFIELIKAKKQINELIQYQIDFDNLQKHKKLLCIIINDAKSIEHKIKKETKNINDLQIELAKEMPSTCPLCEQEIK